MIAAMETWRGSLVAADCVVRLWLRQEPDDDPEVFTHQLALALLLEERTMDGLADRIGAKAAEIMTNAFGG